jgi:hypothetical protein
MGYPSSLSFIGNPSEMSEIFSHNIAALRGFWDRFANPNTINAFKRAYIKKVSFIIDISSESLTIDSLKREGIFDLTGLPIFIKIRTLNSAEHICEENSNSSDLYFIQTTNKREHLFEIYRLNDRNSFERCGLYLPLKTYLQIVLKQLQIDDLDDCSFILYESIDVLQSIEEMKKYSAVTDSAILSFLKNKFGNDIHYMKVSDLVEREFLMSQIEDVHAP